MKLSIQSNLLIIVLIHSSVQEMKAIKKIRISKGVSTRFFDTNPKDFSIKREYQVTGDPSLSKIDSLVKYPSVKTSSKWPKNNSQKTPSKSWEFDKMLGKKKQVGVPSSIKFPQRNYSTIKSTPFRKSFGLLDVKTAETKNKLQQRGYNTKLDPKKAVFLRNIANKIGKSGAIPDYFKDDLTKKRFENLIKIKSIENFSKESEKLSSAKRHFLNTFVLNNKEIVLDIPSTDLVLLDSGYMADIKEPLNRMRNFFPALNKILEVERKNLQNNKAVLYHGMNKILYKWLYIYTKIMELNGQSFPGFLNLRVPSNRYMPKTIENQKNIRTQFLKYGTTYKKTDHAPENQYHLLSCTNSLFASIDKSNNQEGPWNYFANDYNQYKIDVSSDLKFFCELHGLENYYDDINALAKHENIETKGGILLQFILDKPLCNKVVYASFSAGIISPYSENIVKNITDLNKLLFKEKIDIARLQFRMILTNDILLNPQNPETREGFSVNAYAQNQTALDNFHAKVDEFFDGIKKELMQKKKKEPQKTNKDMSQVFP